MHSRGTELRVVSIRIELMSEDVGQSCLKETSHNRLHESSSHNVNDVLRPAAKVKSTRSNLQSIDRCVDVLLCSCWATPSDPSQTKTRELATWIREPVHCHTDGVKGLKVDLCISLADTGDMGFHCDRQSAAETADRNSTRATAVRHLSRALVQLQPTSGKAHKLLK